MKKLLLILLCLPLIGFGQNLTIGDTYQGGIIFYLDGNGGGLIAAPSDQSTGGVEWGCYGTNIPGASGTAIGTGYQNTLDIINAGCISINGSSTAAAICTNLTLGGYSDWFLPSKDELNAMYLNIGQGSPLGNLGSFSTNYYWSSTEYDFERACNQALGIGYQANGYKLSSSTNVRSVRAFSGSGQLTYVPDDNFEDYLETHTAYGGVVILGDPTSMGNGIANDDSVTTANINSITSLNINNLSITDITGVEGFTALTYLNCYNNFLTSLDVGQNTALNYLHCYNNQLTSLDVSNNPILWQLWCYDNQLTNLDVSQNTALTILHCNNNQLTNLDVSQNTTLSSLDFSSNDLTSLDVSQNTALAGLYCSGNDLTILDVSQNTALYQLACSNNQLTSLDVSNNLTLTSLNFTNNQLTSLDVSQNTALQTLYCYNNQLTSLDLRNGNNSNVSNFSSMSNSSLYCIDVDNITFANLNLNGIDSWTSFSTNCAAALGCTDTLACNYNPLVTIDDGSCVYPNSSGTNISICDTTYFWNGFTYTTSGTYTYNTTNAVGCDSIITLDLTVTNSSSSADVQTACDTYTWIDGVTYTASNNTATHTVANAVGCDSIITLDLTVIGNPISTITQNGTDLEVTIADTYSWNTSEITQTITPTANGWYWCIVIDVNGCIGDTAFYEVTNIVIAINETINTEKTLLRVTDLLGRKTKQTNQPLFYIYDDGTVDKRIVIE